MIFLTTITYSEITPESAEFGDFSDTGYEQGPRIESLSDLKETIKSGGFGREGGSGWMSTGFSTRCFRTGTEREENLHVKMLSDKVVFVVMDGGDKDSSGRWAIHALEDHKRTQVYATETRSEARDLIAYLNRATKTTVELKQKIGA